MQTRLRMAVVLGVALVLSLGVALGTSQEAAKTKKAESTVYVCACKGTSSCPCMAMAKMEGKCPCGEHAPAMKAVSSTSAWAKENRKALQ
jgi:hypothetical protein